MAKDVTVQKKPSLPAPVDYGEYSGVGFEKKSSADLAIPFLAVLQPLSPQVADSTVEGAKAGMFFNTVTNELADSLTVLWCHDERKFVEWRPRSEGGGIVTVYDPEDPHLKDLIADNNGSTIKLKNGVNDVVETRYIYVLTLNDNDEVTGFGLLACKSTQLKRAKQWYSAMMMTRPAGAPVFAHRAKLTTTKEKNDEGLWYLFKSEPKAGNWLESRLMPDTEGHLLAEAADFRKMIVSGAAKVDYSQEKATGGSGAGAGADTPF